MNTRNRIRRLLNYKQLLTRYQSLGMVRVFSDNIADPLEISASLVRKDFRMFNISGNQKGGYVIEEVIAKINDILGSNEIQEVIIAGMGRIGEALIRYKGFQKDGIKIVAGFDIDSKKIRKQDEIPVLPMDEIHGFINRHKIKVAIIAVPDVAAQQTLELLKSAGIKGILNFTSVKFKSIDSLAIQNFNIESELVNIIYHISHTNHKSKPISQEINI